LAWTAAMFVHQQRSQHANQEPRQGSNWQMVAWKEQMNR
jgi:hypothetical protein